MHASQQERAGLGEADPGDGDQTRNVYYYVFFGLLFLIAFIILINCIISLFQEEMAVQEQEVRRHQERLRQARPSLPGWDGSPGKVPSVPPTFQPGVPPKGQPLLPLPQLRGASIPTRRDYINHLDSV